MKKMLLAAAVVLATVSTAAIAAVSVDSNGVGSVGKGDVQLAFGWNNSALQKNGAAVSFSLESTSSVATTWTCDRDAGPQTSERTNTTTTTTKGLLNTVTRDNKFQIVGFTLQGFDGTAAVTEVTDGPRVGSCATGWTAINFEEVESGSGTPTLYVTHGGIRAQLN